jgi:hypothetical protein
MRRMRAALVGLGALLVMALPPAAGAEGTACGAPTNIVPGGRLLQGTIANATAYFFSFKTELGRSYSVEVKNVTGASTPPGLVTFYSGTDVIGGCAMSTLSTRDTSAIDPGTAPNGLRRSFTAVDGANSGFHEVKLENNTGSTVTYSVSVAETTMFSPAWTTNGTFDTYWSFQNTTNAAITGQLTLFDLNGNQVQSLAIGPIPVKGIFGTNTVSLGVVRNKVGNVRFSHDGPPGAVEIKANQANFATSPPFIELVPFEAKRQIRTAAVTGPAGCTPTAAPDPPDLAFIDSNCDGIDGSVQGAVFVDTLSGNDANPGTLAAPKKTIQAGIAAAAAAMPVKQVYVSKGTYAEAVMLSNGVSVYGGYDAASNWARSSSNIMNIVSPTTVGVSAENLSQPTEIQLLRIQSAAASGMAVNGDGQSSYGVRIVNSPGSVTVRACTIVTGAGSDGASGTTGSTGTAGGNGGNASGTTAGGAGTSACGATGGAGGPGVGCTGPGISGGNGTQAPGGGSSAPGGAGGASGSCSLTSTSNGGPAPPVGSSGGPGAPGTNGGAGADFGTMNVQGNYLPPPGSNGGAGTPGGGGGGGGSGGGTAHATNFFCTNCTCISSGGGGGGGGGGCGGAGAGGGRGGGGSFAVAIVASNVTVEATSMFTGPGGGGGLGGDGGLGGGAGGGGNGAPGQTDSNSCSSRSGGFGASGSSAGSGGQGGGGAGGTGGPSVCVVYRGAAPMMTATQCTLGGGGLGGAGGTNGVQTAPQGLAGVTGDLRAVP